MSQAEDRTPGIRKAATAEELAGLSKLERGAVRAFEFLASVRLAIFSLTWLGIECIAGALIESQMNTYSAWYLVYGNTRFHLCIGFLALNILCAALIRFPWKRYQTGFVVTHIGLLTLIFGSMLTLRDQLDCLMVVAKGESEGESVWKSAMFDNDRERIEIVEFNPETGTPKATQSIPVNMGPFTWGHKIFGMIPWRDGYVETHKLDAGGELRIKNFWANCQRVPTYVAAEKNIPGRPAALVKIQLPKGDQLFSEWVEFPKAASRQGPGSHSVGNFGAVLAWSAGSALEFDHFLGALPREIPEAAVADGAEGGGLLGWLKVERAGKTHRFRVDDLRRGKPIAIPDTGETIEVTEYFPDAKPGPKPGTLAQGSDEPKNPGLKVRIVAGGKPIEFFALAKKSKNAELAKSLPTSHRLSYSPSQTTSDVGVVGMSVGGKHFTIPVETLREGKTTIPGTAVQVELEEFFTDAGLSQEGPQRLVNQGNELRNPAVKLKVTRNGATEEVISFADVRLNVIVQQRTPDILCSLFVPSQTPSVQLLAGPDGRVAYRAWSRSGLVAAQELKPEVAAPCWPVPQLGAALELVLSRYVPNGRPDARLVPIPPEAGSLGERGIEVDFRTPDGSFTTNLHRIPENEMGGQPNFVAVGDKLYRIRFTHWEAQLPFEIRLDDFKEPKVPGTNQAAMFTSIVTLRDKKQNVEEKRVITMNQPLRHTSPVTAEGLAKLLPWKPEREYILYQTSIAHLPTGPVSTYTVSYDPGYPWKLAGVLCMSTGIFLMFYTGGYFRWNKTTQRLVGLGGFAALVAIGWFLSNSWMVVGVNAAVAAFPTLSSSLVRRPELAGANS